MQKSSRSELRSIILPILVFISVVLVSIFHYYSASRVGGLSQPEVALFTVLELALGIWASWTLSAHFARKNTAETMGETSKQYGQAAIRRVTTLVFGMSSLSEALTKNRESLLDSEELQREVIIGNFENANNMIGLLKTSAYDAIEDWMDYSGVDRENVSAFNEILNELQKTTLDLENKKQEWQDSKDQDDEERERLQQQISRLEKTQAKLRKELQPTIGYVARSPEIIGRFEFGGGSSEPGIQVGIKGLDTETFATPIIRVKDS